MYHYLLEGTCYGFVQVINAKVIIKPQLLNLGIYITKEGKDEISRAPVIIPITRICVYNIELR